MATPGAAEGNALFVQRGADDELRAGLNASVRGFRIEHGAGANQGFSAKRFRQLRNHSDGAGNSHGDFQHAHAAALIAATARIACSADSRGLPVLSRHRECVGERQFCS